MKISGLTSKPTSTLVEKSTILYRLGTVWLWFFVELGLLGWPRCGRKWVLEDGLCSHQDGPKRIMWHSFQTIGCYRACKLTEHEQHLEDLGVALMLALEIQLVRAGATSIAAYPQLQSCSSGLSACARAGHWYRALETFQTMRVLFDKLGWHGKVKSLLVLNLNMLNLSKPFMIFGIFSYIFGTSCGSCNKPANIKVNMVHYRMWQLVALCWIHLTKLGNGSGQCGSWHFGGEDVPVLLRATLDITDLGRNASCSPSIALNDAYIHAACKN